MATSNYFINDYRVKKISNFNSARETYKAGDHIVRAVHFYENKLKRRIGPGYIKLNFNDQEMYMFY